MTDEQFELASAYLDGAVTDEERARVEGDSELLSLVRELRAISTEVSDAPPPSAAARESAIAAALAAFDAADQPTEKMPATPVDVPPAPSLAGVDEAAVAPADALVVPLAPRRRFRFGHAVSVAAAAVVVLAGGIALFRDDAEAPTNDATSRGTIAELPDGSSAPAIAPDPADDEALVGTTVAPTTVAPDAPAVTQSDAAADQAPAGVEADSEVSAGAPPPLPAQPVPNTTAPGRPTTGAAATPGEAAAEAATILTEADAAISASSPAMAAAPSGSAPASQMATAAPAELTSREEFAEFAAALAEPPITMAEATPGSSMAEYTAEAAPELLILDEAVDRCLVPVADPLASDAVYITEDGTEHPIAVVIVSDDAGTTEYGGVDVVSCALVVDTAEPTLVTTTNSSPASTS